MWCDVMWCDVMWCDVMWCDAMRCDAMRCDAMRCDAMRCDVMWCNVMDTSLVTMSLTEECNVMEESMELTEECNVHWINLVCSLDFVGYHHTRSVPIPVLVGGSYQRWIILQTHIHDDNLFKQCTPSHACLQRTQVYVSIWMIEWISRV